VHIGTHMTGTKSLQKCAAAHRAEREARTGTTYLKGRFGANHQEIPLLCQRANRNMPMRSRVPDWCLDAW
jgi:hypothetical protein